MRYRACDGLWWAVRGIYGACGMRAYGMGWIMVG